MARDPPSLLSSSQLRDISPTPTSIRAAKITIIHPQLRDLILPLERGRVLYPRGQTVEEQRWLPSPEVDEGDEDGMAKRGITGSTRPLLHLGFVPNCLTASSTILACGGQHGELHIRELPQPPSPNPLFARFTSSAPAAKIRPFTISTTLPGRSINNSIIIPPSWPGQWGNVARRRRLGYVGRGSRSWDEVDAYDGVEMSGKTVNGEWVTSLKSSESSNGDPADHRTDIDDIEMDVEEDLGPLTLPGNDDEDTELYSEEEPDEMIEYDTVHSPTSASSVATYPNTVQFLHAPRIPHLPHPSIGSPSATAPSANRSPSASSSRRSASFSLGSPRISPRERPARYSLSVHGQSGGSGPRHGQVVPHYVTSRSYDQRISRSGSTSSSTRPAVSSIVPPNPRPSRSPRAKKTSVDVPRILISNNDCTVKVFSLHPIAPTLPSSDRRSSTSSRPVHASVERESGTSNAPFVSAHHRPETLDWESTSARPLDRLGLGAPRGASTAPSRTATGAAFEWVSSAPSYNQHASRTRTPLGVNPGGHGGTDPLAVAERETERLQRELERASGELRVEHGLLIRDREEFERIIGMRVSPGSGMREEQEREERRLNRVGGTRFKVATNHSSLSPDLRMMVSVGDSTEVNLFEVIEGGKEFKKVAVYEAATDAGFSTAWSKDGRKFAVASQDGQLTVWDHRSSRPLAIFHTCAESAASTDPSPSFMNDITQSHNTMSTSPASSTGSGWNLVGPDGEAVLRDPVTGAAAMGASRSGREAARVVKFTPEGSSRDLMVFSEENSNIHMIDAQTFNTHLILPVSHIPSGTADPDLLTRPRLGVEGGGWGIAGVAFDPSGDWLYSGTERTVVEWDLRRGMGGEGRGSWGMV